MQELAKVVHRWEEVRTKKEQEIGIEEITNKVLELAKKQLEEMLKKNEYDYVLTICYYGGIFEVSIVAIESTIMGKERGILQEGNIPFLSKDGKEVERILGRIFQEFQAFSQLDVIKEPFAHQSCIYDIEYNILVSLKKK